MRGGEGIKNNYQIFRNLPKNLKPKYGYQILTNCECLLTRGAKATNKV